MVDVVQPSRFFGPKLRGNDVRKIVCNRLNSSGEEEYLVRWRTPDPTKLRAYSWHILPELRQCTLFLQRYLDRSSKSYKPQESSFLKRKSPEDNENGSTLRQVLSKSTTPIINTNHVEENNKSQDHDIQIIDSRKYTVYNGTLFISNSVILMKNAGNIPGIDHTTSELPTSEMVIASQWASTRKAEHYIRAIFEKRLALISGPRIDFVNNINEKTPSLNLRFVDEYILGEGVHQADIATVIGCSSCKPNMGQGKGCQYTRKCECLEYAVVDESRLSEEERVIFDKIEHDGEGDTSNLPKRFPYYCTGSRLNCLVPFYLDSNHTIYECNINCPCGPRCKTRVVQKGRTVPLTVFKTLDRGWGLRCPENLKEGQFIDTYRGEIITNTESIKREKGREGHSSSYLYSLDKFSEEQVGDDTGPYVIDGREFGSVTRFINHSCEPNCYQFAVCYNKHDFKIYDIAIFAARNIEANEELTFDYVNNNEENDDDEDDNSMKIDDDVRKRTKCLCGAMSCRKWLWT